MKKSIKTNIKDISAIHSNDQTKFHMTKTTNDTSKSKTPTPETTEEPTIASEEIDINNMSDEEYENYKKYVSDFSI